jgi:lipoteichoic acid synthase
MYKKTFVYWVIYSLSFIYVETLFALFCDFSLLSFSRVRTILFSISIALLLAIISALLPKKIASKAMYLLIFIHTFYILFQSMFFDYMGYYLSANTAKTTAVNVSDFVVDFITSVDIKYILYFIPMIVVFLAIKTKFLTLPKQKVVLKEVGLFTALLIMIHVVSLFSLSWFVSKVQVYTPHELYKKPTHAYLAIQELGVNRYGIRDLWMVFFNNDDENVIITPSEPIEKPEVPIEEPNLNRSVKTELWQNLRDNETNVRIQQIDDYLMTREVTPKNEMTGYFKDKNLVYIMVEAFDYIAIDHLLTPTLYKMKEEGWFFDNHYAVKGSCATGESEFMGLLSLIPSVSVCTPFEYSENDYLESAFNLFKQKGYSTTSYHNYTDQFYPRTIWHEHMGSDSFYNSDKLMMPLLKGWPSDLTLFEKAYDIYGKQSEPFMAFLITASMHFPYDVESILGDRYLDLVNQVRPEADISIKRYLSKSIEFDRGLARMFELFENDGILDDTVFVIYADHHPFRIDYNIINDNSKYAERLSGLSIDRSPLLIYNNNLTPQTISIPSSQIDILPTLANLFDLDIDPRLYLGKDLFSSDTNLVTFTNGSWKNNKGEFTSYNQQFVPYSESDMYSDEEIANINQYVKNQFTISEEILQTDYYHYRGTILP